MNDSKLLSLAEKYGTPLYVYDAQQIQSTKERIYAAFKQLDGIPCKFYFFEPTNRNHAILKLIKSLGFNLTVSRPSGIYRAKKLGFSSQEIEHSGFGLSGEDLEYIYQNDVLVNIASLPELIFFAEKYPTHPLGVRVDLTNTNTDKRGIPQEQLLEIVKKYKINIKGLHTYVGSNTFEDQHAYYAGRLADLLISLYVQGQKELSFINLGGGFAYDYFNRIPFSWDTYAQSIKRTYSFIQDKIGKDLTLKFEVGRSLIVNSGYLVLKILHSFQKRGRNFIVVDSNISHLPRPLRYGFHQDFHPFMNDGYHRINLLNRYVRNQNNLTTLEAAVVGNSHYSKDWFGFMNLSTLELENLRDEYIVILDVGAYSESMSDTWTDEPRPLSIMINNDEEIIIAKRESFEELFINRNILE